MSDHKTDSTTSSPEPESPLTPEVSLPALLTRAGLGGALMGMANLVPGISGGTMLLAAGVFPQFVQAVADLTRLRFNKHSILLLGTIVAAAAIVIACFAGVIGRLVVAYTWATYSFFIGLTLGGVPLIWRIAGKKTAPFIVAALLGVLLMIVLAFAPVSEAGGSGSTGFIFMFLAGMVGASAMVLPGISGAYLLLLMGVYVTILSAIENVFTAVRTFDFAMAFEPALTIVLPVGLGVVAGVAGVSNLIKYVLARFPNQTLGLLLGLLLGAVIGLWPFQHGVEPELGSTLKGQTILEVDGVLLYDGTGTEVETKDYPQEFFSPTAGQVGASILLVILGFAVTAIVASLGRDKPESP